MTTYQATTTPVEYQREQRAAEDNRKHYLAGLWFLKDKAAPITANLQCLKPGRLRPGEMATIRAVAGPEGRNLRHVDRMPLFASMNGGCES